MKFANTIWCWQFGCRDAWTPDSSTNLGCVVKIRSIHVEKGSKTWVASLTIWLKPNWDVRFSIVMRSKLVLSWLLESFDFAVKSSVSTVKKGFFYARVSKFISKLSINAWKSFWFWLGDLYRDIKLQIFVQIFLKLQKFINSDK